jgi:PKD repeat protein
VPYHSDDISALVAFGGNKIGVMFSSQFLGIHRMYFAVHQDGAGDALSDWSVDFVHGIPTGNDHINLKADRAGRVFAATKTTELQPSSPRLLLLRRDAAGNWSNTVFGTEAEAHTRPIVLLEDPGDQAHMLAACPQPPAKPRADSGGDICEKTTSVDNLGFAPGIGTPVMRDASSPELNDVTSTKQPVNSATGMLLMANNPTDGIDAYWHRFLPLSTPAPPPVAAAFDAASDAADPLAVHFRDTSTGAATSWLWDFGDGATSKAHHPTHRFAQAGQYTVRLTAASATSTNTTTVTQTVPVTTPVPAAPAAGVAASRVPAPATAARPRPAARYRPSLSLSQRAVQRGRIRLSGSVSRRLTGVRVVLERRIGASRWRAVATTRLLSLGQARSRFAFVLRRRSHTTVFRVVLPAKGNRSRAASRALTVRPRR